MGALTFPKPDRNYWKTTPDARRIMIEHFNPQFFVITMGTGIMAVLMHQNGYQFRGLREFFLHALYILHPLILLYS
jgi:tellurite resistance protein TehA-like permease